MVITKNQLFRYAFQCKT